MSIPACDVMIKHGITDPDCQDGIDFCTEHCPYKECVVTNPGNYRLKEAIRKKHAIKFAWTGFLDFCNIFLVLSFPPFYWGDNPLIQLQTILKPPPCPLFLRWYNADNTGLVSGLNAGDRLITPFFMAQWFLVQYLFVIAPLRYKSI